MHIELHCGECFHRFTTNADAGNALERLSSEGPWATLGDGETFEDRIHAQLTQDGDVCCPQCGAPVLVSEESLGLLSRRLLAHW